MSPKTQEMQMQEGAGVDQATAMFEQGFSKMAYNILLSKMPELVDKVVTFKVLETDLDAGSGIGAFILQDGDTSLYIPVVMTDNSIKPMDVVYDKKSNIFIPLTKEWLSEVSNKGTNELGKGVKTPKTLYSDVDIRNIMVPPITGRFSYASYTDDVSSILDKKKLLAKIAAPELKLITFLNESPNAVKLAFSQILTENPSVLKHAWRIYGEALIPALKRTKTAAKQHFGGALWIVDKDTPSTEFKRIFGDKAGEAFTGVKLKGYAAKDTRPFHNVAIKQQEYSKITEPNIPGVYGIRKATGDKTYAFVMPNPIDLMAPGTRYSRRQAVPGHNPTINNSYTDAMDGDGPEYSGRHTARSRVKYIGRPSDADYVTKRDVPRYLAVFSDGDYLLTEKLVGEECVADDISGGPLHKKLFKDVSGQPTKGVGFFVREINNTFQATAPIEITEISTGSDGSRRLTASKPGYSFGEKTIVTNPEHPWNSVWVPQDGNIVYVPKNFIWVPLKKRLKTKDVFTSALDLAGYIYSALQAVGARKTSLKSAGHGQFSINGGAPRDKVATLHELAGNYGLTIKEAASLLDETIKVGHLPLLIAAPYQIKQALLNTKHAEDEDSDTKKSKAKNNKKNPSVTEEDYDDESYPTEEDAEEDYLPEEGEEEYVAEPDTDEDGLPDEYDADADGDGVEDEGDADEDGIPDSEDEDADDDGIPNEEDEDADGNQIPDEEEAVSAAPQEVPEDEGLAPEAMEDPAGMPQGMDPGADPGMDPGADPGMDPGMAPGMAPGMDSGLGGLQIPPETSPSDMATMEARQQIQQEIDKLVEKMQLVQQIASRTQEISGGAPVQPSVQTEAMGAPPPTTNMATGAPNGNGAPPAQQPSGFGYAPFPPTGNGMAQDPNSVPQQQDPMMGGMQPPMGQPPEMMGDMQPPMGQAPEMMGGMQPPMGQAPGMVDYGSPMGQAPGMMDYGSQMGGMQMGMGQQQPPYATMTEDGSGALGLTPDQINPQFLDQAGQLQSDGVFDAAAVATLAQSPSVKQMVGQYVPTLEKSLDSLGRILLSMWMQEGKLKGEIGEEAFQDLENNLQTTHKTLGALVLKLSQGAHALEEPNEFSA